jgi:hypothetical protein
MTKGMPRFLRRLESADRAELLREIRQIQMDAETGSLTYLDAFVERQISEPWYSYSPSAGDDLKWGDLDYQDFRRLLVSNVLERIAQFDGVKAKAGTKGKERFATRTAALDFAIYETVAEKLQISPYEASNPRVWEYLTFVVAPEIALMRLKEESQHPDAEPEIRIPPRFFGHERNVYRRAWIRVNGVGGDLQVLRNLREDNLVAIFERPSVASNQELTMAIVGTIANSVTAAGAPINMEAAVRDLLKRVTRKLGVRRFELMGYDKLGAYVESEMKLSLMSFKDSRTGKVSK